MFCFYQSDQITDFYYNGAKRRQIWQPPIESMLFDIKMKFNLSDGKFHFSESDGVTIFKQY